MKHIVKDDEPLEFTEWKAGDKMAHRPNWNRVPPPIRTSIHQALMREQGSICCYCESSISGDDSHVEHFRPRKRYGSLQLHYENLLCSCQREGAKGEPRHCGPLKGSWFNDELLISPLEEGCERRFRFTGNGDKFPRTVGDAGAETTIRRLGLDLRKIRDLRAAAIDELRDLSEEEVGRLLERRPDGGFLPFHTTIAQILAR